jgi:hypothetical protein
MFKKIPNLIALLLLLSMFFFAFFSMKGDSLTMDELAHLPAGYSYLTQRDYRLNPEHPPLVKDLSAIPLLFLKNINFPKDHPSWTEGVNNQWWFGNQFLFKSGNDADKIIFLARIPMILLLILLGFLLFKFAQKFFGNFVALLSLFFFSFSPNFIAHGRLVTTDIGATFGVVLTTYFWLQFLEKQNWKNLILASVSLAIALLLKFSLVLLIPFLVLLVFFYLYFFDKLSLKTVWQWFLRFLLVGFLVFLIISFVYYFHIQNYPQEKQISDTKIILESSPYKPLKELCIKMTEISFLRPFAHYFLGLLMATQRTAFGNTVYFLGKIKSGGWRYYFPVVWLLKEPLALHLIAFSLILFFLAVRVKEKKFNFSLNYIKETFKNHFVEFSLILFLIIYWLTSISGNLNIGLRHILPTFPFWYILVSILVKKFLERAKSFKYQNLYYFIFALLLTWYLVSSLKTFPYYLSYFNELAGGTWQGYKYVVDSNYDWGQDLKRLKNWLENTSEGQKIETFYIDYFGGADVSYYFQNRAIPWQGTKPKEEFPKGNYLIVCANNLQGGRGIPVANFDQPTGYYRWLDNEKLIARIGTTLFVYYIQ